MITSPTNEKIKNLKKLQQAKYRKEMGYYLVHGEHLVAEAYDRGLLKEVITTEPNLLYDVPVINVSEQVLNFLSELSTPASVIGVVAIPKPRVINGNVLCLETIQDPGNLGTIIRSARAFGIKNIVMSDDTVDQFNNKVIRATQGAHFDLNILKTDLKSELINLKAAGYTIYGTDVNSGTQLSSIHPQQPYVIIMGSEGQGMSQALKDLCDQLINIETTDESESLNVAIATSIILYQFR